MFLNFFLVFSFKARRGKDKIVPGKTPRKLTLRGVWLRAVLVYAESDSAQCYKFNCGLCAVLACADTARNQIFRENLCENKVLSKTILACSSGAQMALTHEIKKCQKISWHCPFKHVVLVYECLYPVALFTVAGSLWEIVKIYRHYLQTRGPTPKPGTSKVFVKSRILRNRSVCLKVDQVELNMRGKIS